ncbi:MAG: hypothetical protein H7338_16245, partial [Candidatus Sericytochromatia bacterium]|nr:hypothetical protein [Candidatus Sericytochromatia bacterium]
QAHELKPQALPTVIRLAEIALQQQDKWLGRQYLVTAMAINSQHPDVARLAASLS